MAQRICSPLEMNKFDLEETQMKEIKPIAMPGTHQSFLKYFKKYSFDTNTKILDLGAGHGAFTKRLH